MTDTRVALLPDRGVVTVTGADAATLLQGLITNDLGRLERQPAIHAGLLTPQGKILFEFFVVRRPEGFALEVLKDKAAELVKRLTLYKLRAKVEIRDASADWVVAATWNGADALLGDALAFPDPRLAALGSRALVPIAAARPLGVNASDYQAHRIACGVPEGGKDYVLGDTFPHEALFDQMGSVDFAKGCYVGQEVVSRMEHRGTARKRIVPVEGDAALPAIGTEIRAADAAIGTLGSTADRRGLALLRLDRAAEAAHKGQPLTAGDVALTIRLPDWVRFPLEPAARTAPA
jgi:hypothetical protein